MDIYFSHKSDNGKWSKPMKLSDAINTGGNEKSPFMHSDSRTLYFASDSLPGLGGFDLFVPGTTALVAVTSSASA